MLKLEKMRRISWLPLAAALALYSTSAAAQFDPTVDCATDPNFEFCHFTEYVPTDTADADGIVEEGETLRVFHFITVTKITPDLWTNAEMAVCYGKEIGSLDISDSVYGTTKVSKSGKRWCVRRSYDEIGPENSSPSIDVFADTGLDDKGRQEFVRCGEYELNNGPRLKYTDTHQRTVRLKATRVSVFTEDRNGDCDGDGWTDQDEIDEGTDPFDAGDAPVI